MRNTVIVLGFVLCTSGMAAERRDTKTWSGILLDAGCRDRSVENLRTPPMDSPAAAPNTSANPAKGLAVPPDVLKSERAEATGPHTSDHASRYSSASCALTSDTKAFALLLPNGVLMELDEGGNTLAFDAFQST